ncbi:DUF6232 family protein [Actinoplanes auranticolor]|uniref:Uncharacterized protein n=1 Tax=Actinoplanes auranticolor TaxID=47988 RepID=A0A919W3Z1_9ACTN|nr:DUF6232 family protein [Actinoplanes auranticolor]GIM78838.1 hypothetical protein Aau02nite_82810 [Actinoplanes auranticolor]
MITYYRDPDVLVTSTGVRMSGREYRLSDFAQVWHRQGRRSWSAVAGRGVLGIAMIVPLVIGAVGVLVALVINASTAATVALIGGGILIGLAAAPLSDILLEFVDRSYDKGSRRREIWARIRGSEVLLLDTDNAQRFGQIYRALQRALDHDALAH